MPGRTTARSTRTTWRASALDEDRILAKLDELDGFLAELREVRPSSYPEYVEDTSARRASERLLQLAIEAVTDVAALLVKGHRLGLPDDEESLFDRLEDEGYLSDETTEACRGMRGLRNILVHKYGTIDDEIVFEALSERLDDMEAFRAEAVEALDTDEGSDPR